MPPRSDVAALATSRYRAAAVAYAIYGTTYLGGAIAALGPDRRVTFFGFVPWWAFYVGGACLLAVLPVLVWRQVRWLTGLLTIGVAGKAMALSLRQGTRIGAGDPTGAFTWAFAAVALLTAILLLRAALTRPTRAS